MVQVHIYVGQEKLVYAENDKSNILERLVKKKIHERGTNKNW